MYNKNIMLSLSMTEIFDFSFYFRILNFTNLKNNGESSLWIKVRIEISIRK